jgi:hypothetical protein
MARAFFAILGTVSLILALSAAPVVAAPATVLEPTVLDQPKWSALTPQQRQILAPLAKDWDGLESFRRKKWLGIAQRYPTMQPEQQQRVSTQMKTWAALPPEERNVAREKFKKLKTAPPEQREVRRQKWEQYQALPEAEKKKFREKAAKKESARHSLTNSSVPRPLTRPATPPLSSSKPSLVPALSGTATAK